MIEIRHIAPQDTYSIGNQILRFNQPFNNGNDHSDFLLRTFHLGAFYNEELIGVASFYQENNPLFKEMNQYRIRGMTTLKNYRGQKVGSSFILYGESILKKRNARLLWCHTKVSEISYYKKFGLRKYEETFFVSSTSSYQTVYK